MKKYVRVLGAFVLCLTVFGASAGVSGAYLAKSINELNNVITPGSIEIDLTEMEWNPENGKDLVPRESVAKDPTVTNTGKNDAWVFLRVDIPVRCVSLVDAETKRKEKAADTELFLFAPKEGWTLVSKTADSGNAHYVYGYDTVVKPGETTKPLFTEISLVNVLEGELDEKEKFIVPVQAVAIQSSVDTAGEGLDAIYRDYLEQEAADAKGGAADETEAITEQ